MNTKLNTVKQIVWSLLVSAPLIVCGQQPQDTKDKKPPEHHSIGLGIKAGFDFSNVTNASMINSSSRTGFHLGLLLAPPSRSILGSRTELIYSRHGYNYNSRSGGGPDSAAGSIDLDYIMLAQYLAINITKFVQIQLGGQTAYLLNAKVDSSSQQITGVPGANKIISYYNRIDYGYGVGVEVHPVAGLLIGAQYQISLNNLYKQPSFTPGGAPPTFIPSMSSLNLKNNVVQLFIGYRF
jgi:hypothetical protein